MKKQALHMTLLRHGETVFNREHRWQGWSDSPLTDLGKQQAIDAAKKLVGKNFSQVISSPLGRAIETLEIVVKNNDWNKLPVKTDLRIRERNVGYLAGIPFETIEKEFPEELIQRNRNPLHWHPRGGESSTEFMDRTRKFIDSLERESGHILVLTHGGVCSSLYCTLNKLPPESSWGLKIPNTSCSEFRYESSCWSMVESDITIRKDQKFML